MMKDINKEKIEAYESYLYREEKSISTIRKYIHDVQCFYEFLKDEKLSKEMVLLFKQELLQKYQISSVNSMLVAINSFLKFIQKEECCVKLFRMQKRIFANQDKLLTKEEYFRLLQAAKAKKNKRLYILLQTICGTGIRVSELRFITIESVKKGKAIINNKGKIREVFFNKKLKDLLLAYSKLIQVHSGPIFISKKGLPLNRSNIWTSMKALCKSAQVNEEKVFPHNLRHLFAVTYYSLEKDLVGLADLLGHSTVETTRIYTKTSGKEYELLLTKLNLAGFQI